MENAAELQTLIDTPTLKITSSGPSTGRAVVSFTGIGHELGTIQKEEFVKSVHNLAEENAAFYVIDKNRSWYNTTQHEIQSALVPALSNFNEVICLGNSMGGFGAIYFASLFPACRAAIAFCPQFSLAPGIAPPRDDRWFQFRNQIRDWPAAHALLNARDDINYYIFYGRDDLRDRDHAKMFLDPPASLGKSRPKNLHVFLIDRCGHDVAAFLKSRQCLRPLLDGILHHNFGESEIGDQLKSAQISFRHNIIPFSFRALLPRKRRSRV